jgi:hypothetical protein
VTGPVHRIANEECAAQDLPRFGIGVPLPWSMATTHIRGELAAQGLSPDQMFTFSNHAFAAYCPGKHL